MHLQFGAVLSNSLTNEKADQAVYNRVANAIKTDPALQMLMDKKFTADSVLTVGKYTRNGEYMISHRQGQSSRMYIDLGEKLGKITRRLRAVKTRLIDDLLSSSTIYHTDGQDPMSALVKKMKTLSDYQQRQILTGALESVPTLYQNQFTPTRFLVPVGLESIAVELPSIEHEHYLDISRRPKGVTSIELSDDDQKLLGKITSRVLTWLRTDPALLFAFQKSVSPKAKLSIALAKPGDDNYIPPSSDYPERDLVANLRLNTEFGGEERWPGYVGFGNTIREFSGKKSAVRKQLLETVANQVKNPAKVLKDLDTFVRNHAHPVSYLHFAEGTFLALSKSQA